MNLHFSLVRANEWDTRHVIQHSRQSDRREMTLMAQATGQTLPNIWDGFMAVTRSGCAMALVMKDEGPGLGLVIAIGGVTPVEAAIDTGAIWMIGTDHMDRHPKEVLKVCRAYIDRTLKSYVTVGNLLPVELLPKRRRWLQHLGFDFRETEADPLPGGLVSFWRHRSPAPTGPGGLLLS